ncbi:MAG TPA: hypothetical protein DEA96_02670 [Leptospiraceae bacterium]|nr:hypothetical protein [Spirochaetaceae bacterium]HBS03840.1 hypothetical protein [Leptospiraceae bacterium]|tara:strand:- start:2456 stop:2908 length:453 start_codon:yes stop_codon:yes gene_type:complete
MKLKPALYSAAAGALGTLAMTILMLIGMKSGAAPMPEPIPRAIVGHILPVTGAALMIIAMIAHFAYGSVWAALADQLVSGFNFARGLLLGVFLWIIMQVVVLPLIGWGFFGLNHTPAIAVATLVLHLIYGGTTGYAAQKLPYAGEAKSVS